ncbi:MAG: cadmium-translocating P-type ATPase [Clostridia bacterium]|nr:cadmium-translocating P-type ATPase [Clostridia bacterium]
MNKKQKRNLIRIIISAVLFSILYCIPTTGLLRELSFIIPYLIIGYDILLNTFYGIKNGRPFDENCLMSVATIGAFIIGEYVESVAVMLFYQIGELFQSIAIKKSRTEIKKLLDIRPDKATIITDTGEREVLPSEVKAGDILIVKVGEKVPVDGVIIEGSSSFDLSLLTGESVPIEKDVGDEVLSGAINVNGVIKIRAEKEFLNSTANKITELIENASSKKAKTENFIKKFAFYYTPTVVLLALIIAVGVPTGRIITGVDPKWNIWLYRALSFLVISCPCALVISVPLSFFCGLGGASRKGVLIKGSDYLERLSKTRYVLLDKTGTLTEGKFTVIGVHHNKIEEEEILKYASLAESFSTHPIAESVKRAYGKEVDKNIVKAVKEYGGKGVYAEIDGNKILVGNDKLMKDNGVTYIKCGSVGTVLHVAKNGEYLGHILIGDKIKADGKVAIDNLKRLGIKVKMLTGDGDKIAKSVADKLGICEVYSELLPSDKLKIEEDVINDKEKGEVMFVGDGINDAPSITRADVGVAMGAVGSSSAIEVADVVIMDDNPVKIGTAISHAKRCMRIVYENVIFALFIKIAFMIAGAFGVVNMWMAVFADVGVMVIAVLNAIRALKVKGEENERTVSLR